MRKLLVALAIAVGLGLALLSGMGVARAHHRACDPPYPASFTFPRRWSIYPGLDQAPWQLAQRKINLADTRHDWLIQVPWGAPRDIAIIPDTTNLSGGNDMMVILGCRPPWHSNSASILLDADIWPSRVRRFAGHEMMHAAFFYADHIPYGDPNAQYYTNPGWCSYSGGNVYVGGMSYCFGPEALFSRDYVDPRIIDDFDMMRRWYP